MKRNPVALLVQGSRQLHYTKYQKTKILSLVFRSPGIKEEDILDQFESVFNELDVHEVLTFMVSSNLLSAREVKFKSGFGDSGATFQTTKHYFTRLLPHQFVGEWS